GDDARCRARTAPRAGLSGRPGGTAAAPPRPGRRALLPRQLPAPQRRSALARLRQERAAERPTASAQPASAAEVMKRPVFDPNWPSEVVEIYRNDLREMWDPSIERQMFHLYHNQLELYRSIARRYGARTILDVGCAQGTLALLLAEDGHDVTAVDIRPAFLDYEKTRFQRGNIRFLAS